MLFASAFPVILLHAVVKEMEEALAHVVWILCVCSLGNVKPVESSHFMGGIFHWRPVNPAAFDGRVRTIIFFLSVWSILTTTKFISISDHQMSIIESIL